MHLPQNNNQTEHLMVLSIDYTVIFSKHTVIFCGEKGQENGWNMF